MARVAGVRGVRGVLVALAVVAGLFAMHGLSQHGDHVPAVATSAHAGHAPQDSIILPAVVAPLAATVLAADEAPGSQDHDGSGALALCLTVLAAVCLALWATARPRGGVLRALSRAVTSAPRPPARARAPDPPDRWALSVCRC